MRILRALIAALIGSIALLAWQAHADQLPEYGQLSGRVAGSKPGVLPVVYAYNTERSVGYTVFVVNGKYRAVNMIPGPYDVTIRPAVDQLEGFTAETVKRTIAASGQATANFALKNVGPVPNYILGLHYEACSANRPTPEDAAKMDFANKHGGVETAVAIGPCKNPLIQPYDVIFPAGPGRDILERTCLGCHHPQLFAFNTPRVYGGGRAKKAKNAWARTVDRKHKRLASYTGFLGQTPNMDEKLLPPKDRDILIDYLAENFGPDAPSRLVQLASEPELDLKALEKAMFVEYIWREDPAKYPVWPWSHRVDFDNDGNVWLSITNCCVVRFDPRTGESKSYEGNPTTYGIAADPTDGTIWFSGLNRLDPKTGLVDRWIGAPGGGSIQLDTKANAWFAGMQGSLTKYDRKTNTMMWWKVPVVRSRPYGLIVDYKDKVWFADYHASSVTRFDPETETFKQFKITKEEPTDIRRLGVDSKNMIWTADYGSPNRYVNGKNMGGNLYRLNPETGEVVKHNLGIEYAKPYGAEADPDDNIWTTPDNYLVKYDQKLDAFTRYPLPTRTDTVRTRITRDGAVWTVYRNATHYIGYGSGVAAVLYPDKDKIKTLAAYHHENSAGNRASKYRGPLSPPVKGGNVASSGARNAEAYEKWAIDAGLPALDKIDARMDDTE